MSLQILSPFLLLLSPFSFLFASFPDLPSFFAFSDTNNGTAEITTTTDPQGNRLPVKMTFHKGTDSQRKEWQREEKEKKGTDNAAGESQGTAKKGTEEERIKESFTCSMRFCWALIIVGGLSICAVGLTTFILITLQHLNSHFELDNELPSAHVQINAFPR